VREQVGLQKLEGHSRQGDRGTSAFATASLVGGSKERRPQSFATSQGELPHCVSYAPNVGATRAGFRDPNFEPCAEAPLDLCAHVIDKGFEFTRHRRLPAGVAAAIDRVPPLRH
jgi:hypothetical protein